MSWSRRSSFDELLDDVVLLAPSLGRNFWLLDRWKHQCRRDLTDDGSGMGQVDFPLLLCFNLRRKCPIFVCLSFLSLEGSKSCRRTGLLTHPIH